ncbi:TPA: hypothetical protein MI714_25415 [Klebsiella pneumoniae]|nr:hypothetical protein DB361_27265 [Klebsiella pneumoniae]PXK47592.1 hypothetical protein DMR96_24995 [Klebsiella pneumoniae]HBY0155626.1 hypothetical protein [Klebsiella pneumoniae]HBY6475679.1 hypothetical protein [Klebsiella pneumoniae]HBY6504466.1 hypothetical protein [Klebsiella pneumoniae]
MLIQRALHIQIKSLLSRLALTEKIQNTTFYLLLSPATESSKMDNLIIMSNNINLPPINLLVQAKHLMKLLAVMQAYYSEA